MCLHYTAWSMIQPIFLKLPTWRNDIGKKSYLTGLENIILFPSLLSLFYLSLPSLSHSAPSLSLCLFLS